MQCVATGSGFHMHYVHRLLLACSIVTLSACSTMTIELDHDASANFSNLKTYAWVSRAKRDPILTRINDEFVESRVQQAVNSQLATKGYQMQTSGTPDFLVSYYASLRAKLRVRTDYDGYREPSGSLGSSSYAGGTRTRVYDFDQGLLVLDIVDADTKKLMWRGTAKDAVDLSWSQQRKTAKISEAVRKMLSQFPPK